MQIRIGFGQTAVVFILLVVGSYGCSSNLDKQYDVQPTAPTAGAQQLVTTYFEHFNKHDWSAMAAMYADSAAFKDPSLEPGVVMQTRQEVIEKYTALGEAIPDLHDQVLNVYPSGDHHVVVEFVSTGTDPSGGKFELPICTIFTIDNGLITGDYTYYDNF